MSTDLPAPTPGTRTVSAPPPKAPPTGGSVPGDGLLMAVLIGLAAVGLAAAFRKKFATITGKVGELLACDLCVSFWTSAGVTGAWWYASSLPLTKTTAVYFGTVFLAATGLAFVLAKVTGYLDAKRFSPEVK